MSYTVNKIGIVQGSIYEPVSGSWLAEVHVNGSEPLSGAVVLTLPGGFELHGFVVPDAAGVVALRQDLRIVGGAGGLSKIVEGQPFYRETVQGIVEFLFKTSGERLSESSDPQLLAKRLEHWTHVKGTCGAGLDAICKQLGTVWSVEPDGSVKIGDPSWDTHEPEHTLVKHDPAGQLFLCALFDDSVRPGTTFRDQKIQSVEHLIDADDRVRQLARYGSGELDALLRRFVEHALPTDHLAAYDCEVVAMNQDGTVDLRPASAQLGPGWQHVPIALQGPFVVEVQPTSRCILEFLDGDLTKPIVRTFQPGTVFTKAEMRATTTKIDGTTIEVGKSATKVGLGPGGTGPTPRNVVAAGDTTVNVVNGTPAAITGAAPSMITNQVVKV